MASPRMNLVSGPEASYLPPGFRFHPTDEELVSYYLTKKVTDSSFAVHAIVEVDLNKCEPWDLPDKAKVGEKEWYFFSLRDRKYPTGMRTNRATEAGYWKATGKDRDVLGHRPSPHLVGMKKTLVFYRGRAPRGEKTNWIMHEYRLESDSTNHPHQPPLRSKQHEWVVCRIFQKSSGSKKSFLYSDNSMLHPNNYQLHDSHSPNPTLSDEGECDTCTPTETCYNCAQQQARYGISSTPRGVMQIMSNHELASTVYMQRNAHNEPDMPSMRMPKMEPASSYGEDEAQSGQRGGTMDHYTWPNIPDIMEAPITPRLQSLTAGTDQSSCITQSFEEEHAGMFGRLRGYNSLPEMAGPIDSIQECMWAY